MHNRKISSELVFDAVFKMCTESAFELSPDVLKCLEQAEDREESNLGKYSIQLLLENSRIAKKEKIPLCQDTGIATFLVEIGSNVSVVGDTLWSAIEKGMIKGYGDGYLRKSIVSSPLERLNTKNNSPPVIHFDISEGDHLNIHFLAKGAGSENMSRLAMLKPADGKEGVVDFVVNTVSDAGANPCPPIVVGVGIGGTFEKVAMLAKRALFRPLDKANSDDKLAELESLILGKINKLGIGPQGLGGSVTALALAIETYPCHMASLPVAVNINCHSVRRRTVSL